MRDSLDKITGNRDALETFLWLFLVCVLFSQSEQKLSLSLSHAGAHQCQSNNGWLPAQMN